MPQLAPFRNLNPLDQSVFYQGPKFGSCLPVQYGLIVLAAAVAPAPRTRSFKRLVAINVCMAPRFGCGVVAVDDVE